MARKPRPALKHRGGLVSRGRGFHLAAMSMQVTLGLMAILAALTAFAGWRGARPPNLVKGPRMIPWRPLMIGFATGVVMLGAHLAALLGLVTSR
ncbi:MAG: hypothetical protein JWR84_2738 [Caulobacter sp.]|nr:hypothetical protein [Caulobacter sp.]